LIAARGYRCSMDGVALPRKQGARPPSSVTTPSSRRFVRTKHDRMQYELPHTHAGEQHHDPAHEAPHEGHGGMSHDMSDPTMAAAMERDMRNRFFVALVLSIPVFLPSPVTADFFGLEIIGSEAARNWLMLVLSAPVVFWAGWIFIGGAYTSLRRGPQMSVLIAVGVLSPRGRSAS
jgi:cation transport ATPase